jgi:ABC-2 type transport system permease protein
MLLVIFTSVPFLFLAGISWPQSDIPGVWRAVACLFPSTFGIRGFVRLNSMGATLPDIQEEYQALWIQVTVYFFLACLVYRYQIISARKHAIERLDNMKKKVLLAKHKIKEPLTSNE